MIVIDNDNDNDNGKSCQLSLSIVNNTKSRCQSVKVKMVKLVFKTENMTLTSLTLTKMTALQRYSVTVQKIQFSTI